MEYLRPSQADIDAALQVERELGNSELDLYLDCMNNRPMSQRTEPQDQRAGCILTGVFWRCAGKSDEDYPLVRKTTKLRKKN